jgi:hypothetical protein
VPHRAPECHCGFERKGLGPAQGASAETPPGTRRGGGYRHLLAFWGVVLLAGAYGLAWVVAGGGPRIETRLNEGVQGALSRQAGRTPRLPVVVENVDATARDATSIEEMVRRRSIRDATISPGVESDGSDTAAELPWGPLDLDPNPLLAVRLGQIAAEARVLEEDDRAFERMCRAGASVPPADLGCDWLVQLERAAQGEAAGAAGRTSGVLAGEASSDSEGGVPSGACDEIWKDLARRLGSLEAAVERAAVLAQRDGLSRAGWRTMLALHQLACFERPEPAPSDR